MGQAASRVSDAHLRIYQNLLSIQSPGTRMQMIDTLLSSPEHSQAFKTAGIYGHMLHYAQQVKAGYNPPKLPGESAAVESAQGQNKAKPMQDILEPNCIPSQ